MMKGFTGALIWLILSVWVCAVVWDVTQPQYTWYYVPEWVTMFVVTIGGFIKILVRE
jgi:hypothetical protein